MVNGTTITSEPLTSSSPARFVRYVVVACLASCVYDWILALGDEIEMIRHCGRRALVDILYFFVRACPVIYLSSVIILGDTTISVHTSKMLIIFLASVGIVNIPAASALFFIRLKAVYSRRKYVTTFFGVCLLLVVAAFAFDGAILIRCIQRHNYDSAQCAGVQHMVGFGCISAAAYDTLMYLAISWQLASLTPVDTWQDKLRSFVTGEGLGWLSKALLQSGQLYYFTMITFSLWTIVFIYKLPPDSAWKGITMAPNYTVSSLMACRLFRELKLGLLAKPTTVGVFSSVVHRDTYPPVPPRIGREFELGHFDSPSVDSVSGDGSYTDVDVELRDGVQGSVGQAV